MNITSKLLLGLLMLSTSALAVLLPMHNNQRHSDNETIGSVEVLDSAQVMHVYHKANALIAQGDSITGMVLKGALMTKSYLINTNLK